MRLDEGAYLAHYGILRRSGRYPWGSGQNPLQRSKTFLDIIDQHKKIDGMTESQIAKAYHTPEHPFSVADLRAQKSLALNQVKQDQIRTAQRYRDKGMGPSEIGRRMELNESTVRSLLEPGRKDKLDVLMSTADMLKRQVDEKGFIDVGANVERDLPIGTNPDTRIGISPDKFKTALAILKEQGYPVHPVNIKQVGTGEMTKYLVLCKPGITKKEAFANRDKISTIAEKSDDRGHTWQDMGVKPPLHIDSKRVGIRYKEDGGADADGVIYVRPGKKDLDLGKSHYAQVRIAVGGTHYLKGMAVYKSDLPPGVDLMFNTNKSNTGNKFDAMKPLKRDKETGEVDKDLPFGSVIKEGGQILDKHGKPTSVMNKIYEEGDWDKWSKTLSRQVLSKQSPDLIESQLNLTYDRRVEEFSKLKSLTNPQIKKKLLETFGEETDSAAVHLKAAHMPRQATKVILPSNHVKPNEIFAPTFHNGERVALIRYPHAGTFEIPELTVNNKSRDARKIVGLGEGGTGRDAVVIHPKVAERLSGADFDGDSVVVIPNDRGRIAHTPPLEKLKGFDPQTYAVPKGPKSDKHPDGKPIISSTQKQHEMGNVTNLISDMTIKGASTDEISRAVRHSMVVIDSEKHNLDYKASYRDHGISDLKRRYQGVTKKGGLAGASTLITRATAQTHVPQRTAAKAGKGKVRLSRSTIDPKTGKKLYDYTGRRKSDGDLVRQRSKQLAETDDAFELVSRGRGTRQEQLYAEHSNRLKSMANEARKEVAKTKDIPYEPSAKKVYSHEVESLDSKLNIALKNSPLERQAQVVANRIVAQKKRANPDMDKDEEKKIRGQALTEARLRTGAKKNLVEITDREWDAIQAGAISSHRLEQIINNSDLEAIRKRATPREPTVMTTSVTAHARQLLAAGHTPSEVASRLGIPVSTLMSAFE